MLSLGRYAIRNPTLHWFRSKYLESTNLRLVGVIVYSGRLIDTNTTKLHKVVARTRYLSRGVGAKILTRCDPHVGR